MKVSLYLLISILGMSAIWSCKKDADPIIDSSPSKIFSANVEFVDHATGEPVKGLEILFGRSGDIIIDPDDFITTASRVSDPSGSISFVKLSRPSFIKPNSAVYADITYIIDGIEPYNGDVLPFKKCKLLRIQDGVSYYRAEVYRLSPVDIHIKQVTELSPVDARVQVRYSAEDPTDSLSNYYMHKFFDFGGTLQVAPGKKMDTVLRAYAFSDLENAVDWSVSIRAHDPWDYAEIDEYWFGGSIEKKKYPSPGPASITITF